MEPKGKIVEVFSTRNYQEAAFIESLLKFHRIECFLYNVHQLYGGAIPTKVMVPEINKEPAQKVVNQYYEDMREGKASPPPESEESYIEVTQRLCPNCGKSLDEWSISCSACGVEIQIIGDEEDKKLLPAREFARDAEMACPNCGSLFTKEATRCPECEVWLNRLSGDDRICSTCRGLLQKAKFEEGAHICRRCNKVFCIRESLKGRTGPSETQTTETTPDIKECPHCHTVNGFAAMYCEQCRAKL